VTYGLAIRLDDGIVFLSDTRTSAGVDNISIYRKLHIRQPSPDRAFVIQAAGNLATTQEVLDRLDRDLATGDGRETLSNVDRLFEAALYLGRVSRDVTASHRDALAASGADGTATFILGGQIAGEAPEIFLVYPEGNDIRASKTRPFLQIGESKFGKFWLELAVHARVDLDGATKLALASMMSTTRSNLSVGPPFDLALYRNGSLSFDEHRIEADSEYLAEIQRRFVQHLFQALDDLPPVPWSAAGTMSA
jgi:putative proteasome-type protease